MTDQEFEQYISKIASGLSRRVFAAADRQAVWARVQNFLRAERGKREAFRAAHGGFWSVWRVSRGVAAMLVIVLSLGAVGGVAKASRGSLPGDSLYSVKKAVEKVEVVIASAMSDEQKVQTLKSHAKNRLSEVTALVQEKKAEAEVVQKTLQDLSAATKEVVAATEAKPELAGHALELAREEEKVLGDVVASAEGAVKDEVQKALTESRESLSRLEPGNAEVEGQNTASAQEEQPLANGVESATSTPARPLRRQAVQRPKDGILTSPILLDGVTSGSAGDPDELQKEPVIIDEPVNGF